MWWKDYEARKIWCGWTIATATCPQHDCHSNGWIKTVGQEDVRGGWDMFDIDNISQTCLPEDRSESALRLENKFQATLNNTTIGQSSRMIKLNWDSYRWGGGGYGSCPLLDRCTEGTSKVFLRFNFLSWMVGKWVFFYFIIVFDIYVIIPFKATYIYITHIYRYICIYFIPIHTMMWDTLIFLMFNFIGEESQVERLVTSSRLPS